ncbi:MAG: HPF/RaiA family ribosome-associated protein [Vicinamibacteria bacterium]
MKIEIRPVKLDLTDTCRAYAEYRMFSAISRFDGNGVHLDVLLEDRGADEEERYRCIAGVDLPAGRVWVTAAADQIYAVIDRAAEQLTKSVESYRSHGAEAPGRSYRAAQSEQRP